MFTFEKSHIDEKLQEAIGLNIKELINIGKSIGGDNADDVRQDNAVVEPSQEEPVQEDEITPEDRAESSFNLPAQVDTIIKESARTAAKQGVKMLEKAIDDALK